jgi:hypothetical protein
MSAPVLSYLGVSLVLSFIILTIMGKKFTSTDKNSADIDKLKEIAKKALNDHKNELTINNTFKLLISRHTPSGGNYGNNKLFGGELDLNIMIQKLTQNLSGGGDSNELDQIKKIIEKIKKTNTNLSKENKDLFEKLPKNFRESLITICGNPCNKAEEILKVAKAILLPDEIDKLDVANEHIKQINNILNSKIIVKELGQFAEQIAEKLKRKSSDDTQKQQIPVLTDQSPQQVVQQTPTQLQIKKDSLKIKYLPKNSVQSKKDKINVLPLPKTQQPQLQSSQQIQEETPTQLTQRTLPLQQAKDSPLLQITHKPIAQSPQIIQPSLLQSQQLQSQDSPQQPQQTRRLTPAQFTPMKNTLPQQIRLTPAQLEKLLQQQRKSQSPQTQPTKNAPQQLQITLQKQAQSQQHPNKVNDNTNQLGGKNADNHKKNLEYRKYVKYKNKYLELKKNNIE